MHAQPQPARHPAAAPAAPSPEARRTAGCIVTLLRHLVTQAPDRRERLAHIERLLADVMASGRSRD